ncbi:MAG: transcriptional repressor [Bacteroidota bacterium]
MKQRKAKTLERKKVFLHWLSNVGDYITPINLYILMKNNGVKISYTTVYRYLYLLHEDGLLDVRKTPENEMQFCCCAHAAEDMVAHKSVN